MAPSPPGLYAEMASQTDLEEAAWLAFLIAYLSPIEGEDRRSRGSRPGADELGGGELPGLDGVPTGPRVGPRQGRGADERTCAYRALGRAIRRPQAAAFSGETHLDGARRFERPFERLSLPGCTGPGATTCS